jgi:hypothetical protein
MDELLLVQR